jgi:hypothetical protein
MTPKEAKEFLRNYHKAKSGGCQDGLAVNKGLGRPVCQRPSSELDVRAYQNCNRTQNRGGQS